MLKKTYENSYAKELVKEILSSKRKIYVFGLTDYTALLVKCLNIEAIIDECTTKSSFENVKIINNLSEIPDDAIVISTIVGKPLYAEKKLAKYRFDFLDYFSFYYYANAKLKIKNIQFWDEVIEDINKNFKKYEKVYGLFKDDISKNQFFNIVNFKYSYNLNYIRGFENNNNQYFEDFLHLNNEIFVDIGGYTGDTAIEFIKRYNYNKIILFEPINKFITIAKRKLKNYQNIIYFNYGVSNQNKIVNMQFNGSASMFAENGQYKIKAVKIDDIINEKVSYIKMDIEGEELNALKGMKNLLKKYKPKLAIAVYHKPSHMWEIPEYILSINCSYDIYFRHYTEGISESIMYFVPRS